MDLIHSSKNLDDHITKMITGSSSAKEIKNKLDETYCDRQMSSNQNPSSEETTDIITVETKSEDIKCIFLCEFHATAGPKIVSQVPENYISKDFFRIVNRYVIPKIQLQRSFLSVSLLGQKILGYPVHIDNKQYARNAFYFNICFVFDPVTRTVGYEPVVRKLTEYLLSMELSTKLLSQQENPAQLERIKNLLTQVRDDINKNGECMVQEGSALIPLCVVPHYRETISIHPHHAPVLTNNFYKYVRAQWDLTTLRILPFVDGYSHVNKIAAMADVTLGLVKDCVKHLVLLGVAIIVPVFQYSNVYRATPKLSQLAKCKDLQKRCMDKCSKSVRQQAKVKDVFRIFASMAHGATFGEICVRFNPAVLNINEKQLVLFGLMEGLIRSVNRYPVTVSKNLFTGCEDDFSYKNCILYDTNANSVLSSTPSQSQQTTPAYDPTPTSFPFQSSVGGGSSKPLPRGGKAGLSLHLQNNNMQQHVGCHHVYTGLKSFDEICCATGMSCQQLESHLDRDKHVIVLLR